MGQLNPVPVFGVKKKYQYHLTEIFHRNFGTNDKCYICRTIFTEISVQMVGALNLKNLARSRGSL